MTKRSTLLTIAILCLSYIMAYLFLHKNSSPSKYLINQIGKGRVSINLTLLGDNGDDSSFNIVPLPINPDNITTPEQLLKLTNNRCYFVMTYDPIKKKRLQYSSLDMRTNTLKEIQGGKTYLIRCRGNSNTEIVITGVPIKVTPISPSVTPNWIALTLSDDGIQASQLLNNYSSTKLSCRRIRSLRDKALDYSIDKPQSIDFNVSPTEGYELFCHQIICPTIPACQVDQDDDKTVTDLDLTLTKLNQTDLDQNGVFDQEDINCAESKILQEC